MALIIALLKVNQSINQSINIRLLTVMLKRKLTYVKIHNKMGYHWNYDMKISKPNKSHCTTFEWKS